MATKTDKKNMIRTEYHRLRKQYIVKTWQERCYLYVYGNEFFEVSFPDRSFSAFDRSGD